MSAPDGPDPLAETLRIYVWRDDLPQDVNEFYLKSAADTVRAYVAANDAEWAAAISAISNKAEEFEARVVAAEAKVKRAKALPRDGRYIKADDLADALRD